MSENRKILWYCLNANTPSDILEKVYQSEYEVILVHVKDINKLKEIKLPQRMKVALQISELKDLEVLKSDPAIQKKVEYVISSNTQIWETVKKSGEYKVGLRIDVNDRKSLDESILLIQQPLDIFVIEFKDPTNIPLELVLAMTQNSACKILKKVKSAKDGEVSLLTMEMGADGIVLDSENINEVVDMSNVIAKTGMYKFELKPAVVTEIKPVGMGTRVCIDTSSILTQDEGMILGSTSSGGLMTCSETHFLPYMNLRAFRVNAGGVHLYIWGPNDQAVYLSDLKSGDKVYVVNSKGESREVVVGRLKMESRPLLHIVCDIEGTKISTFIQDDWHVRMFGSKGEIRPSSEIKVGDKLLGYLDSPGRHLGVRINETINEK